MTTLHAHSTTRLSGLYVITDPEYCGDQLIEKASAAIRGGAQIIQYRNKDAPSQIQHREAQALSSLCSQHGRVFLVNDNVDLAMAVDADGVHLGQSDIVSAEGDLNSLRKTLEKHATHKKIIGITCHRNIELAVHAQQQGADYVAFGRFYTSQTKPDAPPARLSVLAEAKHQLNIPIVAIGGITHNNAATLLDAGADMLAVIHGVFAQDDVEHAAQSFTELFTHPQ